jgi:hypothetical protein
MGRTRGQAAVSRDSSAAAASYRRTRTRILPFLPLLLSGVLLTACSGGSPESADPGGASPTSANDRGLAFAKCMRENGVKKFPDPGNDGSQIIGKDSGIDPQSPEFKKAEEACKDVSPQGAGGSNGGKPADLAKARTWAKCVRDHGVADFPDPEKNGNALEVDMTGVGTGGEDPTLDKALEDCQDKRPSGNLRMTQNGGGQ